MHVSCNKLNIHVLYISSSKQVHILRFIKNAALLGCSYFSHVTVLCYSNFMHTLLIQNDTEQTV